MRGKRPGRGETLPERMWRLRGVIAVGMVPVLLIGAVAALMPTHGGHHEPLDFDTHGHPLLHAKKAADAAAADGRAFSAAAEVDYAVIIDAGSTGSRVHCYRFNAGDRSLIDDAFEQLKPGLSSYKDDPTAAAESLEPLLASADRCVPPDRRSQTPVAVRATAGLRMLPGDAAENILAAVRAKLGKREYAHDASSVSILDGADEGAYQWVTLNYLLGRLDSGVGGTVAAVDLGGGSVQLAHAIETADAAKAPEGYVRKLAGFSVYVHSYLGFGLMAARKAILGTGADEHGCIAGGITGEYAYGGNTLPFAGSAAASAASCAEAALSAMEPGKACGQSSGCSFAGAWGGGGGAGVKQVFVSSYFFDRAVDAAIVADPKALSAPTTPAAYRAAAEKACGQDPQAVTAAFPGVPAEQATYFCLDLTYCHSLLTEGFGIADKQEFTLVKQVEYNGAPVEAAWPLGAAIDELSSA